jgi:hypothetical protein
MNYGTSYIKAKNHGFVVGSTIFFLKCRLDLPASPEPHTGISPSPSPSENEIFPFLTEIYSLTHPFSLYFLPFLIYFTIFHSLNFYVSSF